MLDGGAHSLRLHAFDISARDARSEKSIFTKVLKITTIHRCAINVHARPQQEMHAFSSRISADFSPDALGQGCIPGRGQTASSSHGRAWPKVANAHWSIR